MKVDDKNILMKKMIIDEIRKNKEASRKKRNTKTSFKKGQVVPGCGRKKGSKNDPQKKTIKFCREKLEENIVSLVLSIASDSLQGYPAELLVEIISDLINTVLPGLEAVEAIENRIAKNGVSNINEIDGPKIIDARNENADEKDI